jgi:hypothetical protein
MNQKKLTIDAELEKLQRESFDYFLHEVNPGNGLILDKTAPQWPSSIAATGLALASYPVAVERSFISRSQAAERTLNTLRFFWNSHQGPEPDATGYKGFYYHFLDMNSGKRAWQCELSTIDTTLLIAGMLTSGVYFDADNVQEKEIRNLADALYSRVDWQWAQNQSNAVTLGWTPENGFLPCSWEGYDEGLLLYILGLGSATHPLPEASYSAWTERYKWEQIYGYDYLYAGSFFTHQYSHIWIDFRHIQDGVMREKGSDYFKNSRYATYVQQQYAIHNPQNFVGYSKCCWGISASDGPGPANLLINGVKREFFDYVARSVPDGPDDGTISPWSAITSLPFAPEIVLPMVEHCIYNLKLKEGNRYGLTSTFNQTYQTPAFPRGWISPLHFGINQGPIVLMIENYRSGLVWSLMRSCPHIVNGLKRAGFTGGWLG